MKKQHLILPGTPDWDALCQMCGLCCLLKTIKDGRVYMTRVRCGQLDAETHKCHCYNVNYNKRNDNEHCDSCIARGGSAVNLKTLHNEYVVPGFCPYVKKFVGANNLERPNTDWSATVSEDELPPDAQLSDYIIPGSSKYFRYNPIVNKLLEKGIIK